MNTTRALPVALLLVFTLLTIPPATADGPCTDDFESYALGSIPDGGACYDPQSFGPDENIITQLEAHSGEKSWYKQSNVNNGIGFETAGDWTEGETWSVWFKITAFSASGASLIIQDVDSLSGNNCGVASGPLHMACVSIGPTGGVSAYLYSSSRQGVVGGLGTVALDTWFLVSMSWSGVNPDDSTQCDHMLVSVNGVSGDTFSDGCAGTAFGSTPLNRFFTGNGPTDSGWTGFLDDLGLPNAGSDTPGQNHFCSDPTIEGTGSPNDDFGYNYVEGVAFYEDLDDAGNTFDLGDGYAFSADDDNWDYLGKAWGAPGTSYTKTIFRIEALTEGRTSVFRTALSFENLVPDATTKGDGDSTQSFQTHIASRFLESGSDWRMNVEVNNGGTGPTQIGGAIFGYDPNTPHTFSLVISTTGDGFVAIKDEETGEDILNRTMAGSGYAGLEALAGGDPMLAQWFIGQGTSAGLNALTALDDPADTPPNDEDSTCVFFTNADYTLGSNVSVEGDPGTDPPSQLPPGAEDPGEACTSFLCVGEGDVPDGFTAATFNFMLGLIMLLIIGLGIWFTTHSVALAGGGFVVGYLMGLAFGLLPLWPIVILAIVALAVVFLRFRGTGA